MTLKQRIEKLDQANPQDDDLSMVVLRRSLVSRSEGRLVLTEAVRSAFMLASDSAPSEHHKRKPGESEQAFVRHVLDRACIVWNRPSEAFRDSIRWTPGPDTHVALKPERQLLR